MSDAPVVQIRFYGNCIGCGIWAQLPSKGMALCPKCERVAQSAKDERNRELVRMGYKP